MCNRGIGRDDQVKRFHDRCGVDESIRSAVEVVTQRFDLDLRRQPRELIQSVVLLQADQSHSIDAG